MKRLLLPIILLLSITSFAQPCQDPQVKAMKAQFAKLDPETKVTLWRAHILKQLQTRQLNEGQRTALAKALQFLTPNAYLKGSDEAKTAQDGIASLKNELHNNFSMIEGADIFDRIDRDVWDKYAPAYIITAKKEGEPCTCSTRSDWCWSGSTCCNTGTGCTCTQVDTGCGTFWVYPCNGLCKQDGPIQ